MRLEEISKEEFVDKLRNPAKAAITKKFAIFQSAINDKGWEAELRDQTDNSVLIYAYRVKRRNGVSEIRYTAYMYFIDNGDLLAQHGITFSDIQESPDKFQLTLSW